MKQITLKKLVMTALLAALAVVCSPLSIPVGISKCFPAQHFVNIISGVFLGPWYAMAAAFVTSLCRVLMGTGTAMAFPGSMIGAFFSGMLYRKLKKLPLAYAGELFGTAVIGGLIPALKKAGADRFFAEDSRPAGKAENDTLAKE